MQVWLKRLIETVTIFLLPSNNPSLRCPIFSGVRNTFKIYLLLDFIVEGEILAIVSEGGHITAIQNISIGKFCWIGRCNHNYLANPAFGTIF